MTEKENRADWFRRAEANSRLEGFDPTGSPEYQALRSRVISGEISADEALRLAAARWSEVEKDSTVVSSGHAA